MAITLPVAGQQAWDVPLNLALANVAHRGFDPADFGLVAWNYDAEDITSTTVGILASGVPRMFRLPRLTQAATFNRLWLHIGAVAVGAVAGQCFVGIYNLAGTRLAVSADISGSLGSTGAQNYAFTAPLAATAGTDYVAAVLVNAATPPILSTKASVSAAAGNVNLSAATARYADGPAAQTTLPASITMASRTTTAMRSWVGVN